MGEYTRLATSEGGSDGLINRRRGRAGDGGEGEDLRYRYEVAERVPWRSILLALLLMLFGTLFFVISHLILTSHIGGESSQAYGFLVLGFLVFIPGFYETRIAYYSWRGFKGYSYSRIPAY